MMHKTHLPLHTYQAKCKHDKYYDMVKRVRNKLKSIILNIFMILKLVTTIGNRKFVKRKLNK